MNDFHQQCANAVVKGLKDEALALAARVVEEDLDVLDAIENGFSKGIRTVGQLWENGEYFLPELAFSAEVMKAAMDVLQPALKRNNESTRTKGTVVVGTVQGDIHDIGKSLVATMLSANGFSVFDLGNDVRHGRFVDEVARTNADLLCMSALLTTTMVGQVRVIELLRERGLRDRVKVLVGGAPASHQWASEIGADGYADNAVEAVRVASSLVS